MGDLTEAEIFSQMEADFLSAAYDCRALARGERGPLFRRLRASLWRIEGCCRQAAAWRDDARWLKLAPYMGKAVDLVGVWLVEKQPAAKYLKLGEMLLFWHNEAKQLKTQATGKRGMILPRPQPGPHRDTRPVSMSGLILPDGFARQ